MIDEDQNPAESPRHPPRGGVDACDDAGRDCPVQGVDRAGPLPVFTLNLSLDVRPSATDWTTILERDIEVPVLSAVTDIPAPPAMLIRIGKPAVTVRSYCFPELPSSGVPDPGTPRRPGAPLSPIGTSPIRRWSRQTGQSASSRTRFRPPKDIVKLQDRLYYLLQPPLESLASSGQLDFPFQPFAYQYQGVAFLYPRYAAVLADEMGLGKTMQAITSARLLLRGGEARSILLVCPKPLVTNWKREFALWAPELPVGVIEGDQPRRRWQWQQTHIPVTIANYELLLRDADLLQAGQVHFDLVILDEAQRIKNRSSTTSQVVRSISRTRSWALTGTPIENSPDDLVAIFEFLMPGYLRSDMRTRRIAEAVRDYVLRRTKDAVLADLPPKLYRDAQLDLSGEQWDAYRTAEEQGIVHLSDLGESLTIQHVFELILRLKQICNFDPASGASTKLERLEADLEEVAASGKKAIVFSQWVRTLETIRDRLARYRPLEYHGRIPARKRDAIIEQFRQDPRRPVLLMSYGAGSVGLNLQFAGYVFLFDRWWNPAVEDQAINRAHRIGVEGPVTVTRMLTLGTIEERIEQVLEEKRRLFAAIFSHTGCPDHLGLTQQDIFGLFQLPAPRVTRSPAA
jgi:SNF2 family DNA or RNA helicase